MGKPDATAVVDWTRSAAENNQANFVVTTDPILLRSFEQEYERMWTEFA